MTRATRTPDDIVNTISDICLALPEVQDKPFGGHTAPSFRVRDKIFVKVNEDLGGFTCKAPPGVQEALVGSDPDRFYVPDYVGRNGWIGVRLDVGIDVDELVGIIEDSYRMTAPKRLLRELDAGLTTPPVGASERVGADRSGVADRLRPPGSVPPTQFMATGGIRTPGTGTGTGTGQPDVARCGAPGIGLRESASATLRVAKKVSTFFPLRPQSTRPYLSRDDTWTAVPSSCCQTRNDRCSPQLTRFIEDDASIDPATGSTDAMDSDIAVDATHTDRVEHDPVGLTEQTGRSTLACHPGILADLPPSPQPSAGTGTGPSAGRWSGGA